MVNFKTIEKKIIANGWIIVRGNGSHYQYKHPDKPFTIIIHNSKDLSISLINNLEKTTGLSFR